MITENSSLAYSALIQSQFNRMSLQRTLAVSQKSTTTIIIINITIKITTNLLATIIIILIMQVMKLKRFVLSTT